MRIITLYHGTPDKIVVPRYGGGDDKHDYGKGFYLTESVELAKEWAVCRPNDTNGWVHKYELETDEAQGCRRFQAIPYACKEVYRKIRC